MQPVVGILTVHQKTNLRLYELVFNAKVPAVKSKEGANLGKYSTLLQGTYLKLPE